MIREISEKDKGVIYFMNIDLVIHLLSFSVLIFIAAELYIIAREISRALTLVIKDRETRDGQGTGQTINVNLAPTTNGASTISNAGTKSLEKNTMEIQQTDTPKSEAETEPVNPSFQPPAVKAAPSGPFSVKCPRCQAENSSYRGECFNCGERL